MHSLICGFCSSDRRFARGLVASPHPASFRFAVTCNTLAFGYILPTTGRIRDFHPLETCAARRTTTNRIPLRISGFLLFYYFIIGSYLTIFPYFTLSSTALGISATSITPLCLTGFVSRSFRPAGTLTPVSAATAFTYSKPFAFSPSPML